MDIAEILESITDAFSALDPDFRYIYVNERAVQLLAKPRDQLIGQCLWDLFPESVGTEVYHKCQQAMAERVSLCVEAYFPNPGKWYENYLYPTKDGLSICWREITERKRAEEALRQSNNRIESILESIYDTFVEFDLEWRYTYLNQRALGRAQRVKGEGLTREDLLGKNCWEEFPALVGTTIDKELHRALREQKPVEFEAYSPATGTWVEMHAYPSGHGLSVYSRDITERKKAEKQRAYHAHLLENIRDAVTATDERFALTAWNKGAEKMFGWTADEVLGRNVWEVVRSDMSDEQRAEARRQLAETGGRRAEVRTYRKDGAPIWVESRSTALRGPQGEITGYLGIHRDITERKRREKELERSQAYLAEGQRLTKTGSWSWTIATGEVFWSEEEFRLYGWDPSGAPPSLEGCLELIHPDDRAFIEKKLANTLTDVRDYEWDCRIVAADGTVKHVHTTAHPILENGALVEYVGTTMDVTDRIRGAEALRRTQDALARVTRVMIMGELMASVAHELNQPLAAVVAHGNAGMRWLAREPTNIEEARHAFERIVRDGTRAGEILRRIRSVVMGTEPVSAPVEIGPLVSDALVLLQDDARERYVTVREFIEGNLPSVQGDAVQLQQAVYNLALNGIEAMSGVGSRPRVLRVDVKRTASDAILVALRDSGPGFDADLTTAIFEPFYTTKLGGLGMGLSISRTIVESHGGVLWATTDSAGTTFQFTLPVPQDAAQAPRPTPA
jgi:PAS domain S-box-containing protein